MLTHYDIDTAVTNVAAAEKMIELLSVIEDLPIISSNQYWIIGCYIFKIMIIILITLVSMLMHSQVRPTMLLASV